MHCWHHEGVRNRGDFKDSQKRFIAEWRLGNVPSEALVQWATDALVEGIDSPSLRELAGLGRLHNPRGAGELFPRVVEELLVKSRRERTPPGSSLGQRRTT